MVPFLWHLGESVRSYATFPFGWRWRKKVVEIREKEMWKYNRWRKTTVRGDGKKAGTSRNSMKTDLKVAEFRHLTKDVPRPALFRHLWKRAIVKSLLRRWRLLKISRDTEKFDSVVVTEKLLWKKYHYSKVDCLDKSWLAR